MAEELGIGAAGCQTCTSQRAWGGMLSNTDFSKRAHVGHFVNYLAFVFLTGGQTFLLLFM